MNTLNITRIEKRFTGYGHNEITITVTGNLINDYGEEIQVENYELKCTSTNTTATDAYFDPYYDDEPNGFHESREQAATELVNEVFRKNQVESTYEIEC